jgi:glycerol-3-phosphate O-acyltransferase
MDSTITLPAWLAVLLILLSLALLLDRVLIPSVRWYLRRRINRVIDEVNTRLDIEVRPFQQTRRQILIDQLSHDERVASAVRDYARENDMPREVAQAKVNGYAREIVPSFNAYVYFRVGYWIARRIARLIYRVRVGFHDKDRLASVNPDATVVFVMNHRSNMDYILIAFLAAEKTALSYAIMPTRSIAGARRNQAAPLREWHGIRYRGIIPTSAESGAHSRPSRECN